MTGTPELDGLTEAVIGAAIEVHRTLGPGFVEAVYERALCIELADRSIPFVEQATVLVQYRDLPVGEARIDVLVADALVLELRVLRDEIRRIVWTNPQTSAASSPSPRLRVKKPLGGAGDD